MLRNLVTLFIGILILAGCGGGGLPRFNYGTQWFGASGGINGASQTIQLFDQNNILQFSTGLNSPDTTAFIDGVPAGTYHLHVILHSGANQTGSQVGFVDDLIVINGSFTYMTSVGVLTDSVDVTPGTATFQDNHTQQFYATAHSAANKPTFTAPNGFTWSAQGGVATVNSSGLATGTNPGTGTITATHVASGNTGIANVTVQPGNPNHSKWTVLVFMNAANNLYADSVSNMNQMEQVASNDQVRFVVQWKQSTNVEPSSTFNSTRRYLVKQDATNAIASELVQDLGPGLDMGLAYTLTDFVNWAKTNYPADRYVLIMWNHGNGWKRRPAGDEITRGVSYDDETGNHIDTWQMPQALGANVFDILAWDSSLMQQLEVAAEVRTKAQYIVGSEESPPAAGYPYHKVFENFRDNPDDTTLNLAKAFVDETVAWYGSSFKITQSVIDSSQLPALITATSNLGDALTSNVGSLGSIVPTVRATSQKYSDNSVNGRYRDLYDVCTKLADNGAPVAVTNAGAAVQAAIANAVVHEGHNIQSPGSHGVSIDFSSSVQFAPFAADYQNLQFAQDTNWDVWLQAAP